MASLGTKSTIRFLEEYREQPFVSISDSERRFLPGLNYVATVYNGINLADFEPDGEKG